MRSALALAAAVAAAGCLLPSDPAGDAGAVRFSDSFEEGLAPPWSRGHDLPDDPNDPDGGKVAWSIERDDDRARTGAWAVNMTLDGRQDDGTIWVSRTIDVEPGVPYDGNVSVAYWSGGESFNTVAHAVVYIGEEAPANEEDWPQSGSRVEEGTWAGLREPLNLEAGWRAYEVSWTTPPLASDEVVVAVGITAVWETRMVYYVDDVRVDLTPRAGGGDAPPG